MRENHCSSDVLRYFKRSLPFSSSKRTPIFAPRIMGGMQSIQSVSIHVHHNFFGGPGQDFCTSPQDPGPANLWGLVSPLVPFFCTFYTTSKKTEIITNLQDQRPAADTNRCHYRNKEVDGCLFIPSPSEMNSNHGVYVRAKSWQVMRV